MIPAGFPTISIDPGFFRDIGAVLAAIDLLGEHLDDFDEPLTAALELVIIPSIAKNFEVGGRPKWAKLSTSWALRRIPGPILIQTGAMFQSTQAVANWTVSDDSVQLDGLNIKYAPFHQYGTRKMPARPFVMYQPEDVEEIVQIFEIWVDGLIDRYWTN